MINLAEIKELAGIKGDLPPTFSVQVDSARLQDVLSLLQGQGYNTTHSSSATMWPKVKIDARKTERISGTL